MEKIAVIILKNKISKEEVDVICNVIRKLLLPDDKNVQSENHVDAYPLYLTMNDIMDATQYGKTTVYQIIHELEDQVPKAVIRRPGQKGIRVHRDIFFQWFASLNK